MNDSPQSDKYYFGTFELVPGEAKLFRKGVQVKIQDLPFRLLVLLIERAGEIITRDEIR
ncbi:MAG: winged helix-turn-helix domain-containing protein [Terriglobales bacterium]